MITENAKKRILEVTHSYDNEQLSFIENLLVSHAECEKFLDDDWCAQVNTAESSHQVYTRIWELR